MFRSHGGADGRGGDEPVAMENGVDGALGRHAHVSGQAAHQQLTDLPGAPMRLLALDGDDARLELGR